MIYPYVERYRNGKHHSPSFQSFPSQFTNWQGIPLAPLRYTKGGDSSFHSE